MPTREQVLDERRASSRARASGSRASSSSTSSCPTTTPSSPKPCMGGWGAASSTSRRRASVLPCHAAEIDPGPSVRQRARQAAARHLAQRLEPSRSIRGTEWMQEPCRTCALREVDWGGCRCQAFALTGDAAHTDPACSLSPMHAGVGEGGRCGVPPGARRSSSTGVRAAQRPSPQCRKFPCRATLRRRLRRSSSKF